MVSSEKDMLKFVRAVVTDSNVCYVISSILLAIVSLQIVNGVKTMTINEFYIMVMIGILLSLSTICSIIISFKTDYIFKTKAEEIPNIKLTNTTSTIRKYNIVMISTLFISSVLIACYYVIR